MNKISNIAINVLSCFFLLTGCDSKSVTDETTKNITFTVKLKYIDAESTPLAGSKIDIVDDDDQLVTTGTLDKYGMFSFDAPEDKNCSVAFFIPNNCVKLYCLDTLILSVLVIACISFVLK